MFPLLLDCLCIFVLPKMKLNLVMFVCNLSQKYITWNKTQNFVTFLKIYTNIQHLLFSIYIIYNNKNIQLNKWHTTDSMFASLLHKRFLSCFAILLQVYTYFTHTAIKYCSDKIFKSLYFHMSLTSILSPFSQGCQYTVSNAVSAVLRALTLREQHFFCFISNN